MFWSKDPLLWQRSHLASLLRKLQYIDYVYMLIYLLSLRFESDELVFFAGNRRGLLLGNPQSKLFNICKKSSYFIIMLYCWLIMCFVVEWRWSARAIKSFAMGRLEARKMKYPKTETQFLLLGILMEGLLFFLFFFFTYLYFICYFKMPIQFSYSRLLLACLHLFWISWEICNAKHLTQFSFVLPFT